ncbi:FAD-dependent oxidoreductase [Salipaludibacillus aurantiacus]|uniref:2-polyprenyl-6-methoxyphenol hydroxylase n=1 Tax=Salipaludibacillus aurantiacus TaxID=1601833 RepID=A0A1H9VU36_9BACI|nr:NAD(P)/FAD-dependent oxidoreductase [Salipaludibacillus aurantiacus]SES25048.1 2-polyprenyl-6-methoxyphenol hydroxylase [Salipaludibacillus aurantiacus]
MEKYDVVIIGGGIGGLTLALKLVQADVRVLVVEKAKQPGKIYKGELLQPKSLEIFKEMGIAYQIVEASFSLPTIHTYEMTEKKDGTLKEELYIPLHYNRLSSPFPEARMIPHEKLKELVIREAEKYPAFTYWNPATFQTFTVKDEWNKRFEKAKIAYDGEEVEVEAHFFVGAEGRSSLLRKAMNEHVITTQYNHQFLTVTFPRPKDFTQAKMYASHDSFIGLFPLPEDQVRSVMLIKPGQYKEMKKKGLHTFYKPFERFEPGLKGYPENIQSWKEIQLMIPIRHNIPNYVKGNAVIIGDAAHTVHPMAGEGMNLAIQDGAVLGELFVWMFKEGRLHPANLRKFEKVRKKRADRLSRLSHLSALAYSWPYKWVQRGRMFALKRLERHPVLHYKHMLNISGIGWWPYSALDGLRFLGPGQVFSRKRFEKKSEKMLFSNKNDYPWYFKNEERSQSKE